MEIEKSNKEINIDLIKKLIVAINENRACTNASVEHNNNTFEISHSIFSKELNNFYKFLYDNEMIDTNCYENYKKIESKEINSMSFEEIITLLTLINRKERFCDGAMYEFIKSGKMLECLTRLLEIADK